LTSSARTRPVGYLVAALIASCAPFAASTGDSGDAGGGPGEGGVDGGGATDEGSVADGTEPLDGSTAQDSSGFSHQDGGFCGNFTDAIECFDFDESNPPSGLTLEVSGGLNAFGPTFFGGSAPTALLTKVIAVGGMAVAKTPSIDFVAHPKKTITIDFRFSAPQATASELIGRLDFDQQSTPLGLDAASDFLCGLAVFPNVTPGVHSVSIAMAVDAGGSVTLFTCKFDGSQATPGMVQPSKTLTFELGNTFSGSGSFSVVYDNVVVRVQ
jgi:hypothetical protein